MAISGHTRVVGIIGHPITHTMSPAMHNAEFQRLGLDYVYIPWDVAPENVPEAVRGMRALNIAGSNVTIPHKEAVLAVLDEVVDEARIIGAVNTIKSEAGKLTGYDTDVFGWSEDIAQDVNLAGKNVCVLGAGGAARAICVGAAMAKAANVVVVSRTVSRSEQVVNEIAIHYKETSFRALALDALGTQQAIGQSDVIVNSTPVGMAAQPGCPISKEWLRPHHYIYDTIYSSEPTELLKVARALGCRHRDGSGMLVRQGAKAFHIWTGVEPSIKNMTAALRAKR